MTWKSTEAKAGMISESDLKDAREFADSRYRKAGCSPNIDGKWHQHRDDFLAGIQHERERVRKILHPLEQLKAEMKDLPEEVMKLVNQNFWELLA